MTDIMSLVEESVGISPEIQVQIIKTIIIVLIMTVLYTLLRRILYKVIENTKIYYRSKKIVNYIMVLFATILIGRVWFIGVRSVTTFIGIFSAGLAIAMKDLVMNIAGCIFILSRQPFRVGDRVEIEGISGDVIDVQIFDFTLMEIGNWVKADQSTGRIVNIPNRDIFNNALFNYNQEIEYIWNEIEVVLTFQSNWRKAKNILQEIAIRNSEKISEGAEKSIQEASKKFMIFDAKVEPTVYTSTNQNGVVFSIRYMSYYKNKRGLKQKIWEEILSAIENNDDIEFAYSTHMLYERQIPRNKEE